MVNDIVQKDCLARKIKNAIDNKQDLTLSYEELIGVYSSYLMRLASDIILENILKERYGN